MLVWGWVPSARVPGLRAAADATVTRRLLPAPSGSSANTGTSPTQVDFPVGIRKPRLLPAAESCMVAGQGGRAPHDAYLAAIKTHFLFCHDDKHWAGRLATGKLPSPEPHPNSALTPPATEGPVLPSRPTLTLTLALTPARAGECRAHIHGLDRAMHDTLSECPGDRGASICRATQSAKGMQKSARWVSITIPTHTLVHDTSSLPWQNFAHRPAG